MQERSHLRPQLCSELLDRLLVVGLRDTRRDASNASNASDQRSVPRDPKTARLRREGEPRGEREGRCGTLRLEELLELELLRLRLHLSLRLRLCLQLLLLLERLQRQAGDVAGTGGASERRRLHDLRLTSAGRRGGLCLLCLDLRLRLCLCLYLRLSLRLHLCKLALLELKLLQLELLELELLQLRGLQLHRGGGELALCGRDGGRELPELPSGREVELPERRELPERPGLPVARVRELELDGLVGGNHLRWWLSLSSVAVLR